MLGRHGEIITHRMKLAEVPGRFVAAATSPDSGKEIVEVEDGVDF